MFCDVTFMYKPYHDCARTLKRSLSGKLVIVELSGDFGFACNSSKYPCTLASFLHARCLVVRVPATLLVSCTVHWIKSVSYKKNFMQILLNNETKLNLRKLSNYITGLLT